MVPGAFLHAAYNRKDFVKIASTPTCLGGETNAAA